MFELAPPRATEQNLVEAPGLEKLPALANALAQSPYLSRLCRTRPDAIECLASSDGEDCVRNAIKAASIPYDTPEADGLKALRLAKSDIHLALANLDLGCKWDWAPVTRSFSEFADAAIESALRMACWKAAESGWISWDDPQAPLPGLFVLALGKLGAHELNYSSDVDLVAMFDPDLFPAASRTAGDAARRIIQHMSQLLEQQTEHGYVLRVDLRLRPDPRSTPVAISTSSAELYYENSGQNWERMAYIKARPCAGDPDAANAFLDTLEPFVWRRHLDFWAIEDIRAIKQQIHSHGGHQGLDNPAFDVKLGRGGIREIEFFAQTQQLIHGGRTPELRGKRTVDVLQQLAEAGHTDQKTADDLCAIYARLRGIEHRIQMLNDEHTHTLKEQDEYRDRVAALCGFDTLKDFDAEVRALRICVHDYFSELFKETKQLSGVEGNLVFTGVDEDPETVETLKGLGFSNPSQIISDFQVWHRGGIRATRSTRSRQLLTAVERRLFKLMAETGNPDTAFEGLRTFLGGLSSGIQSLSLLAANPAILTDLIEIFSVAPRLARDLANRPELLEALLDGGFAAPILEDSCGHIEAIREVRTDLIDDFEGAMNEVRRNFHDAHFRVKFKMLQEPRYANQAGLAFTRLADTCIQALTPVTLRYVEQGLGPAPGRWAICGLGKLGSQDLTSNSDLDLMVIFKPDDGQSATQFFTRATQRLITALSAQTEEGLLYEADMQLRPSGRAGPVAVRFPAFAEYYRKDAWTWEHMALTRLRPVAGDPELMNEIATEKEALLSLERDISMVCKDGWEMRERLLKDRPAKHDFDLKLIKGGMIDIEFLAQIAQLIRPNENWGQRDVAGVLSHASKIGLFTGDEAELLKKTYHDMQVTLSLQRVAFEGPAKPEDWPVVLKGRAARALSYENFDALCAAIGQAKNDVWDIFCKKIQPGATEWG